MKYLAFFFHIDLCEVIFIPQITSCITYQVTNNPEQLRRRESNKTKQLNIEYATAGCAILYLMGKQGISQWHSMTSHRITYHPIPYRPDNQSVRMWTENKSRIQRTVIITLYCHWRLCVPPFVNGPIWPSTALHTVHELSYTDFFTLYIVMKRNPQITLSACRR